MQIQYIAGDATAPIGDGNKIIVDAMDLPEANGTNAL